jgi:hypothetical protein
MMRARPSPSHDADLSAGPSPGYTSAASNTASTHPVTRLLRAAVARLGIGLGRRPLTLTIEQKRVTFNAVVDFEFCLASRTQVPASRFPALLDMSAEALSAEAENLRQIQARLSGIIASSLGHPRRLGALMDGLDGKLFSQDYDWRAIMEDLNRQGAKFDKFRRVALMGYMRYLGSRQELLASLHAWKADGEQTVEQKPDDALCQAMQETAIYDRARTPETDNPSHLTRLPRTQTVAVRLPAKREMELSLAGHSFKLIPGRQLRLVDRHGGDYPLVMGPNIVGRHAACDVVVNPAYRDISRRHLIIEILSDNAALITDLSSLGTWCPEQFLKTPA